MNNLTKNQLKILDYLKSQLNNGTVPSVREICSNTQISSTSTVHTILKSLEEQGSIQRDAGRNRCIKITGFKPSIQVPILGTVTAGNPIFAFEETTGHIPFNGSSDESYFALKIKGYSMKNVGILDGDIIIAQKTELVRNGDIAVVLIEDEATVKTFYLENGKVRLQPENDDFDPIYPKIFQILGKVVSLTRSY